MKQIGAVLSGVVACLLGVGVSHAVGSLNPVALSGNGVIVGAAFSPDSSRLAIMRNVAVPGLQGQRHIMEVVELKSGKEIAHADVLEMEDATLASGPHFIVYSPDARYLLLAANGSDVLSILNAASLQTIKQVALHPQARTSVGQGRRYFRGVISLAVSSSGDSFGALTHDELQGNEVFIGSFSSGRIIKGWSLGQGRTATQLGQTSLSLGEDGSKTAVSLLPEENSLPKGFNNLRLYDSGNGEMLKSMRTDGLVGQVMLLPGETILVSRIDTPGLFSKKTCIEKWSFGAETLNSQFCDQGRTVSVALGASLATGRVVGFASELRKSIEGHVYAASGRVDAWDIKTGSLIASSAEIPRLVSSLQVSSNGNWIMADQMLLQFSTAP